MPARVIAASFALISFACAALVGMHAGNSSTTIIVRATVVMVVTYLAGRVLGAIAQRTIDDHIASYKKRRPIPKDGAGAASIASADHINTPEEVVPPATG